MTNQSTKTGCQHCHDTQIDVVPHGSYAQAAHCPRCSLTCQICDGTGWVFSRDDLEREMAARCECQTNERKIGLFNIAKIPCQFYDVTFDNFEVAPDPTLKTALVQAKFLPKNYQKGKWQGLLFMGGVGVGKTRLVCTMIRDYTLNYGIPCLFKEFSSLLSEIKTGYDQGLSESHVLDKINTIEILVIDELGKGRGSEWELNILDTIISNRYNMRKTTVFTTNYTDNKYTTYQERSVLKTNTDGKSEIVKTETLEQRVQSRIYSRLREMCDFVEIKGGDFRNPPGEIRVRQ